MHKYHELPNTTDQIEFSRTVFDASDTVRENSTCFFFAKVRTGICRDMTLLRRASGSAISKPICIDLQLASGSCSLLELRWHTTRSRLRLARWALLARQSPLTIFNVYEPRQRPQQVLFATNSHTEHELPNRN